MFTDLHFICKEGEKWSEEGPNLFKTGDWQVDRDVADEAEAGGRVFLHRRQKDPAFHGGRSLSGGTQKTPRKCISSIEMVSIIEFCARDDGREGWRSSGEMNRGG
jgi:hypothetical protein